MRKKVNGEVAYGDTWPRKAEALFCLLRFTMAAGSMGWLEMDRVRGGSASGEGREPNCKLRSSNASMVDVKKHAAGEARPHPGGEIGKVESRCR
jgi:hypothetical protein